MLFYSEEQVAELCPRIAAEDGGLEKEEISYKEYAALAAEAVKISEAAHAEQAAKSAGVRQADERRRAADEAHQVRFRATCMEEIDNPVFDSNSAMDALDRDQQAVQYFRSVGDYGRHYVLPRSRLKVLEADAELAARYCSLISQQALIAGVERYHAAQTLLDAEGTVSFVPGAGRTGELLEQAKNAFADAQGAAEAVTRERSHQIMSNIGIAFDRAGK